MKKKQSIKTAKLFVCASCEWIFKERGECPKCSFAYYSAHYVYGNKAYRYAKTQEPWLRKKVTDYEMQLMNEIEKESNHEQPKRNVGQVQDIYG